MLPGDTWSSLNAALTKGTRGLSGRSSLAQLLAEERGVRNQARLPPYTIEQILAWADAHHARTGDWPQRSSGPIAESPGETWATVSAALTSGLRGLPGGSSLAQLLAERRGRRNIQDLPPLRVPEILGWADAHFARTGGWPEADSGPITEVSDESWRGVENALRFGARGLPGGSSLAKLLAKRGGKRNRKALPPFRVRQILAWADEHYERTGKWPISSSGPVAGAAGETWTAVDLALRNGLRRLPGGTSLARLLAQRRNVRNSGDLPSLTIDQILAWADEHRARTGQWPRIDDGAIPGTGGETWNGVSHALNKGYRGLPGGSSLARLLDRRRGTRRANYRTTLAVSDILAWADAYHTRHGRWPGVASGAIAEATHVTWNAVSMALRVGSRGLPGGSSLAKLLLQRRSARSRHYAPRLTKRQVLAWAKAHRRRTGRWPSSVSGPVVGAAGETWTALDLALRHGLRGLPGGSSLSRLLHRRRQRARFGKPR
ncbi:MAG TPA: hypothetical protein VGX76_10255 [Pirellulales bacterium]|nr:hypothetical protein [Pirellulales bacterium]